MIELNVVLLSYYSLNFLAIISDTLKGNDENRKHCIFKITGNKAGRKLIEKAP